MTAQLLSLLLHASQPNQVADIIGRFDHLRESRLACRFQLNDKMIPTECYTTLRLEKKMGIITGPKARLMENQLNLLCAKLARSALSRDSVEVSRANPSLSHSCRIELQNLVRVLKYREHEDTVMEYGHTLPDVGTAR